ncbi:MAG: insulinase family protein [Myxococcaceae bacterium]
MTGVWCAVLVGLISSGCAGLLPNRPVMADTKFRMREFRLANGLRVIVEEDHAAPLVAVVTVVGVGSAGDPAGKAGLAHLLEHLAFRAKPGGKDTAWNQLERAGVGFLNASTSFDQTIYMESGSKDLLPTLLQIELGRMLDPLNGVDQKTFLVERDVVRNELRQRGENSVGPAFNVLQGLAFPPDHPYSQPVGGSHTTLDAIAWDDARAFTVKNYRPDNMTMLIIGDVDLEHVDELIKKALPSPVFAPSAPKAPWPVRLSAQRDEPPTPPAGAMVTTRANVASPELYVVWTVPRAFDSDTVLLDFASVVARRELASAANDPDIAGIGIFPVPGAKASMLIAQATLNRGDDPQRSANRILDQMVKIWSGDAGKEYALSQSATVLEQEFIFSRLRSNALVSLTVDAESLLTRGVERATAAHFTGDPLTYSRRLKALADVTPGQVSTFAEKYLARGRARTLLVLPLEGTEARQGSAAGLAAGVDASQMAAIAAQDVVTLGRAHTERAKSLETVVRATRDHIDTTLPNGLRVVVRKRRDALPVAAVELTLTTGSGGTEPFGAPELGDLVASPRNHSYEGAFGISWNTNVGTDRTVFFGTGGAGNVPNMLAQLSARVSTMYVEGAALAEVKSRYLDSLIAQDALPVRKAERALQEALFRGHPFSKRATYADAKGLSASEVEGWYSRAWTPERGVLVVAGAIDAEATLADVQKWFGGWSKASNPFTAAPPITLRQSNAVEVVVTPQPSATQAQVHLACLVEGIGLDDELRAQVTSQLVGTTLFEKIRGELGASYGFGGRAHPIFTPPGGVTRIDWSGSIDNARLGDSMKVIAKVLNDFEGTTLNDASLGRARWAVARDATMAGATSPDTAESLTARVLAGQPSEGEGQLFDALSKVDRDGLSRQWKQCRGHLVMSVVGDEAMIRAAVTGAGLSQ